MAAALTWHDRRQPGAVEARPPARDGVAGATADKARSRRVTQPFGHSKARARATCAAGAPADRLNRTSETRSVACTGRNGSLCCRDIRYLPRDRPPLGHIPSQVTH